MKLKCATCGVGFVQEGPGAPAKFCRRHRKSGNRTRDLKVLAARDPEAAKTVAAELGVGEEAPLPLAGQALLLASALRGAGGNARRAAGLVALEPITDERLAEVEAEAREAYPSIVDAEAGAALELLQAGLQMLAARVITGAPKMPPSMVASGAKSLQNAIDSISGGARPIYVPCEIVIPNPYPTAEKAGTK